MAFSSQPLPPPPSGWFAHRHAVLRDGALAVLFTDRDIDDEYRRWLAARDGNAGHQRRLDFSGTRARLSVVGEDVAINVPVMLWAAIDRFPDGRWLIAARRANAGEANGVIFAPDGTRQKAIALGDGIGHLGCAADGSIWVGYFDEGVFGATVGSGGLVQFDERGHPLWSFNDHVADWQEAICDCYAMAICDNAIWSCSYTGFAIVRTEQGKVTRWVNRVAGAKAIAVDGQFVLLAGGYESEAANLSVLELGTHDARLIGTATCAALTGASLLQGRGSTIHVVNGGIWTRIRVRDVLGQLTEAS